MSGRVKATAKRPSAKGKTAAAAVAAAAASAPPTDEDLSGLFDVLVADESDKETITAGNVEAYSPYQPTISSRAFLKFLR